MGDIRLYRALLAIPIPYRAKLLTLASAAAGLPLIGLTAAAALPRAAAVGWAFAATALALAALAELLRPIGVVALSLERCVAGGASDGVPRPADEAARMLYDIALLEAELVALRDKVEMRHPVSGLPTREAFLAGLDFSRRHASRVGVMGLVRFLDFDRLSAFDQVAADQALESFSRRLTSAALGRAAVGHVDRDAFAVWFDAVDSTEQALAKLQTLTGALGRELSAGDARLTPEIAASAAAFPRDGQDGASLLARAFTALPASGGAGLGKVSLYSRETAEAARQRFSLQQGLRHAIDRDELFLQFQPVVDLAAAKVVGAEALLRWRSPERGVVSPAAFVPILEQSGMMEEVGLWVLDAACAQARDWRAAGLDDMKMAVNLSARQLRQGPLLAMVAATLERHGLDPKDLELELTESAAIVDDEETRALLAELRAIGVDVAIDDFGAGYSSLSNLRKLPFSKLKIDREFVAEVDANRDNHAICSSLVELARGLEIAILAEGAETLKEVETLRGLGCSTFQGFFFSRPLFAEDFAATVGDPDWLALLASPVRRERTALERRLVS